MSKTSVVSCRVPPAELAKLDFLAKERGVSRTAVLLELLTQTLEGVVIPEQAPPEPLKKTFLEQLREAKEDLREGK